MTASEHLHPKQFLRGVVTTSKRFTKPSNGVTFLRIKADHPEHGHVGQITVVVDGNGVVPNGHIGQVDVRSEFRRMGLATMLAKQAEQELGHPLVHSPTRTDMGDAWAKSYGGALPEREDW